MKQSLAVYGFGSAFQGHETCSDVDLLIVHDDTGIASCALAIQCKQQLTSRIPNAHVTMLSKSEEAKLCFVEIARAFRIGLVLDGYLASDVEVLVRVIADCCQRNGFDFQE